MRVALTGGTGFIGRIVREQLLVRGHHVLSIQRRKSGAVQAGEQILLADIKHPESYAPAMEMFQPEVAIHLAWEGIPDFSLEMCLRNHESSARFIDVAMRIPACRKVIAAGTCWEYGCPAGKCAEDAQIRPTNPFTWAKSSLYQFGMSCADNSGKSFAWLRPFFVYGPGQRSGSLIPSLAASLLAGNPLELRSPDAAQDFVYVGDVASAFVRCAEAHWPSGVFNVGSGALVRVGDVAVALQALWSGAAVSNPSQLQGSEGFYACTEKAFRYLDWQVGTPLYHGLKSTLKAISGKL